MEESPKNKQEEQHVGSPQVQKQQEANNNQDLGAYHSPEQQSSQNQASTHQHRAEEEYSGQYDLLCQDGEDREDSELMEEDLEKCAAESQAFNMFQKKQLGPVGSVQSNLQETNSHTNSDAVLQNTPKIDENNRQLPNKDMIDRTPQKNRQSSPSKPVLTSPFKQPLPNYSGAPTTGSKTEIQAPLSALVRLIQGEQYQINDQSVSLLTDKRKEDGKLTFTNYKLCFRNKHLYHAYPIGMILKLERMVDTNKNSPGSTIDVTLKTGQVLRFRFGATQNSDQILKIMGNFVYSKPNKVFAFDYCKAKLDPKIASTERELMIYNGWDVYQWQSEFKRMGLNTYADGNAQAMGLQVFDNVAGKYCISYPRYIVVPFKLTEDCLNKCLKFRSRERVPILSYVYTPNNKSQRYSYLWRSSQAKLNNNTPRNFADEQYLRLIGNPRGDPELNKDKNLIIYDIRQKSGVILGSTKIQFPIQHYKNAAIKVVELDSLSALRDSYQRMMVACSSTESTKWLTQVSDSKWIDMAVAVLKQAASIVQHLPDYNILIQCPEGVDRGAQLAALAALLLDPYYRTFEGFTVLIEKQFMSYGHPFGTRLSIKRERDEERAPVFLQFLDCVNILTKMFPLSFEYTSKYLARLAEQVYSNKYGNFICCSELEQMELGIQQQTVSVWQEIRPSAENDSKQHKLYTNAYYIQIEKSHLYRLNLQVSSKGVDVWKEHFLQMNGARETYDASQAAEDDSDYLLLHHQEVKKIKDQLRKMVQEQDRTIQALNTQLRKLQDDELQSS